MCFVIRNVVARIKPEAKKIAHSHQDGTIKEIFDQRSQSVKPISKFNNYA